MINFRFHIASLIAVFLALALGVLMGYGVLSQPTVSGLQHRIDTVENNANERKRENDDLHDQLNQLQGYVDGTAQFATAGRLDGVTVVVLAARRQCRLGDEDGGAAPTGGSKGPGRLLARAEVVAQ